MSERIVQLNEEVINEQTKKLVRGSVEETLNELLEAEAEKQAQVARYERSEARHGSLSILICTIESIDMVFASFVLQMYYICRAVVNG